MPTVRPTRLVDTIGMLKERKSPKLLWLKAISIWFRKKTIGSIWAHAVFQKPLKTSYDVRFSGHLLPEWKRQVPYQLDIQSVEWAQQSEKGPWPQDWVLWWIRFNLVPDYQFMIFSFAFSNFETQGDLIKPRNVHECTKWWWEPWRRTTGSIDMSPFWPLTFVKFIVVFWKVFVPDYFIYCVKKRCWFERVFVQCYCFSSSSKDNTFPFPWTSSSSSSRSLSNSGCHHGQKRNHPSAIEQRGPEHRRRVEHRVDSDTMSPRMKTLSSQCQALGCISLKLCDLNALAGAVLLHAIQTLESLFRQQEPLIFKVGFSHDPIWRWSNDVYGYKNSKEKWSHMIILYYAKEPYSPAMLEAALIEKYKSTFLALSPNPPIKIFCRSTLFCFSRKLWGCIWPIVSVFHPKFD